MGNRNLSGAQFSPHKDNWESGERACFEYHCLESHDSSDAQAWYRSQQPVTVLGMAEEQEEFSKDPSTTFSERMEEGMPRVYKARWDDGYEHDVWEDELLTSPEHYTRQPPPRPRR